ncbi:MAG: hypothetical protein HYV42_01705 [Candidatus Magasanikbacteria bacterium]|nr:hypothetical protein [Candidatus Magasanikbacteria bacterium]
MKILAGVVVSIFVILLFAASSVWAAVDIGSNLTQEVARQAGFETSGVTETTFSEQVGRVIKAALGLAGTVFLALTIYAGILWMTASGNEEQVTKATGILRQAIIGLIIVLSAYGLVVFVLVAVSSAGGAGTVGGAGASTGPAGFWKSFGGHFKNNWWRYLF